MPTSPEALVEVEPCPLRRFCLITAYAKPRNWLDEAWSHQRLSDLRILLTSTPSIPKSKIAADARISRQRVYELSTIALEGCPA